jgi:hypothetical protein
VRPAGSASRRATAGRTGPRGDHGRRDLPRSGRRVGGGGARAPLGRGPSRRNRGRRPGPARRSRTGGVRRAGGSGPDRDARSGPAALRKAWVRPARARAGRRTAVPGGGSGIRTPCRSPPPRFRERSRVSWALAWPRPAVRSGTFRRSRDRSDSWGCSRRGCTRGEASG